MNHNRRERRDHTGVTRGAGQRTPRSGGRTAAQRTQWRDTGVDGPVVEPRRRIPATEDAGAAARARGAHGPAQPEVFPTEGSAALRASRAVAEPATRVLDTTGEPGRPRRSSGGERTRAPRLRVAPPAPVAVPRAPFAALILVLVVGGVLGILLINTKINENSFRQQRLQEQQAALDLEQQRLKREIATRSAPGNLAVQSRKLGLVDPGPPAFIQMPDGQVIGVPQPGTSPGTGG